jgi:hypothetical protein
VSLGLKRLVISITDTLPSVIVASILRLVAVYKVQTTPNLSGKIPIATFVSDCPAHSVRQKITPWSSSGPASRTTSASALPVPARSRPAGASRTRRYDPSRSISRTSRGWRRRLITPRHRHSTVARTPRSATSMRKQPAILPLSTTMYFLATRPLA